MAGTLAAVAGVLPARAELARVGSELEVNSNAFGRRQPRPVVAMDAAGRFVVVWEAGGYGAPSPDGSGSGVLARHFDASNAPLGPEFLVGTYTTGMQFDAAVASNPGGRFTVSW